MGDNTYRTSQMAEILGLTRDALRYYEEKGIIKPKQKEENNYREYDFFDIYTLLVTDFYKKRNLSIKEVKQLQAGSEIQELEALLMEKALELEEEIRVKQYTLQKISETREFCKSLESNLNQFSMKRLPVYEVIGEISDFDAVLEYPIILDRINLAKDDMLSKVVREFAFNETGFLGFKMYMVEKSEDCPKKEETTYLKYPNCIYTIVEDGRYQNQGEDPKISAFHDTLAWAQEQGYELQGIAYAMTRLITYASNKERIFLEIFVPIKEK